MPKIENMDFHHSASMESCVDDSSLMTSNEITQNKIMALNNNGISFKIKEKEKIPTENTFELDDFFFTKTVDSTSTSNIWPKYKRISKYFVENPYDSPYLTIGNEIKVFGICTPTFLKTRPIGCALCDRGDKKMFRCILISSTIVISSCFLCYKLVNRWVAYNTKAECIWDHERSTTNMEFIINLIKLRLDEKRKPPLLFDRNNELILNMEPMSSIEEISQISLNKLDPLSNRRRMSKGQTIDAYLTICSKLNWNPVIVQSYLSINRKKKRTKRRRR